VAAKKNKKKKDDDVVVLGFLGVGLDGTDGHKRITQSDHFVLVGGSEETHEKMQETVIRFDENLRRRGKRSLRETTPKEAIDLLRNAIDS
jgi:hypothetical protein